MAKKTSMENHYDVLQIKPGACHKVIESAYNALICINQDNENKTKEILKSYRILIDSEKRSDFDAELRAQHKNQIGSYKIIRKIAEGGFGRVYEGEHILLGEKVCIKHNINVSPEDTEMFIKEAKAIWDLRHYALPAVRDMITLNDGSCALVMSFIEGPTLFKVVEDYKEKNTVIDAENASWIMSRILDALRYLHFHGVIHGDVKPQNVILEPEKHTAVLVDFGLSSIRPTASSKSDGYTPMFAAPEMLLDPSLPLIPESDLFSLGLTMIFALGGDPNLREVPKTTPKPIKEFIEQLIRREISSRPNWEKNNIFEDLRRARLEAFGREHTNYKKL